MNNEKTFTADINRLFKGKAHYQFVPVRTEPQGEVKHLVYNWEGDASSDPHAYLEEPVAHVLTANTNAADRKRAALLLSYLAAHLSVRHDSKTPPGEMLPHFAIREKPASQGIPAKLIVWQYDEQQKTRPLATFLNLAPEILYTIKEWLPAALRDVECEIERHAPQRPPSGAPKNGPAKPNGIN